MSEKIEGCSQGSPRVKKSFVIKKKK